MGDGGRIFTEDELRQYDGQNGRPAYIAYDGKVYDVSNAPDWRGGMHKNLHYPGLDLTRSLRKAPHDATVFRRVPQVGVLASAPTTPPPAPLSRTVVDRRSARKKRRR
jgi:predicted heme/steroid binding protein